MTAVVWTAPAYEAVARWLGSRTGLSFSPQVRDGVEQGIRRAMARAGSTDPSRYLARIESEACVLDDLIAELTIGETYFFREPTQFEFIRRQVLPLIRQRRGNDHVIRAWSTACASGEEAYSLAILFDQEGLGEKVHLLATDISRAALEKARLANYSNWSLRGESAPVALSYLSRRHGRYVIGEKIRRRVTFDYLNLAQDVYPSFATGTWGMDLILCRNVLIYFDSETVRTVARRLFESLAPGGWLITASSDPPLTGLAPYEPVGTDAGLFYRRGADLDPQPLQFVAQTARALPLGITPSNAESSETLGLSAASAMEPFQPASKAETEILALSLLEAETGKERNNSKGLGKPAGILEPLAEARHAFRRGDYARTAALTCDFAADAAAAALHVRSLANWDLAKAEGACAEATVRHPFSTELHYLHALVLFDLGCNEEATRALGRVLYLDCSLAMAHFTLGSILQRRGDLHGARRAYRNAKKLSTAQPADETVQLSDGERAGRLAEAAAVQLAVLDAAPEVAR